MTDTPDVEFHTCSVCGLSPRVLGHRQDDIGVDYVMLIEHRASIGPACRGSFITHRTKIPEGDKTSMTSIDPAIAVEAAAKATWEANTDHGKWEDLPPMNQRLVRAAVTTPVLAVLELMEPRWSYVWVKGDYDEEHLPGPNDIDSFDTREEAERERVMVAAENGLPEEHYILVSALGTAWYVAPPLED